MPENMTVVQLRRLAGDRGITGASRMKKQEILDALTSLDAELPPVVVTLTADTSGLMRAIRSGAEALPGSRPFDRAARDRLRARKHRVFDPRLGLTQEQLASPAALPRRERRATHTAGLMISAHRA